MQNHFIHPNQKYGGQRRRQTVCRNPLRVESRALERWVGEPGKALGLQGKGRRGRFVSNPGPSVHVDRHLPKSQNGLTNARGN